MQNGEFGTGYTYSTSYDGYYGDEGEESEISGGDYDIETDVGSMCT